QSGLGAVSNAYGFYAITAEEGSYSLVTSFAGFANDTIKIVLTKNIELAISLNPSRSQLEEVVVNSRKKNDNITKAIMGVQKLSINEIKNIPVLFGEKDVLKTIQLLPGIKTAGEGNSGFYVRGGGADQNLILLDEATVYNASHLLGFFSTFNSDAIKDITVYKGGMPAEYGGRLSSVVDIKTNDGSNQKFGISGGIGLISSRLNAEGPIVKNKGSFNVSARRTYADLFLALSKDSSIKNNKLFFYDLNGKADYKLNDKNRLFLSIYNGRDNLGFGSTFGIDYGNTTATLRWNHIFNNRLFSNTSLIYTNYSYKIKITAGNNNLLITSKIRDFNLKQDFQYYLNATNKVNFGINLIHHNLIPGAVTATQQSSFNNIELQKKYSVESAAYISHEWSATDKINVTYGLRISAFTALGPGNFYSYDGAGNVKDTATFATNKPVKTYSNLEPRFATSFKLNDRQSVKFSYTRNVQNIHLLSNATSANPTDLYIGSSNNVQPEIADQVALGYYQNFNENTYEFSAEIYYKALQNQIDYKNGAELRANENVESQLIFGKGRTYGLELFFKKKYGKLNGWVGYTLSKAERQFEMINNGNWYNATQDRTHEISVVGIYQASKKWTVSATFVYYTGNAVTFPSGKYNINGQTVFYYTERNGYRMPDYHRLDIGATLQGKKTAKTDRSWTFSIYNAYSRENAFAINFQEDPTNAARTQAVQTTLFKIVPAITYNFKF
ncbi:MAG: TonB-dependent receptor plug domain-containing protein, partial [Deinococcales bacterium]|nr:TonB-dependent receptor plug domain-containing protein [Chitinophagaceae bacterium]